MELNGTMPCIVIIHVDDDIDYLKLFSLRMLKLAKKRDTRINIYSFNNFEQLQKFLSENSNIACDIAVVDYELGSVDGITVLNYIKQYCEDVIRILVTSTGSRSILSQLTRSNIEFHFHKSMSIPYLVYEIFTIARIIYNCKKLQNEVIGLKGELQKVTEMLN